MWNRRDAIALGLGSLLVPAQVRGQIAGLRLPRLGFLSTPGRDYPAYETFVLGLNELGYHDAQNIQLEPRFAERHVDRLPGLVADLISLRVDVIAAVGAVTTRAVRAATQSIPTVFSVVVDPVTDGLVADSLKPGGHATGVTNFDPAQAPAQIRLLKTVRPNLTALAILGDAGVPELLDRANRTAAEAERLRPVNVRLRGPSENIEAVFRNLVEQGVEAVIGLEVPAVGAHAKKIVALTTELRMPLMLSSDNAVHNPLIAYGSSFLDAVHRMAGMVDRILKGSKPADLPIEVVTRHRLVINLKFARAIDLSIPSEILTRADRVVD